MNDYISRISGQKDMVSEGDDEYIHHEKSTDLEIENAEQVKDVEVILPDSTIADETDHVINPSADILYGLPKKVSVKRYVLKK